MRELRRSSQYEVTGLLTTINQDAKRVAMHAVREELLDAQAEALGVPLLKVPIPAHCSNADYESAMESAMAQARAAGVLQIAFGDLFLEDIRRYREEKLQAVGMKPIFPLWGRPTAALAREMIVGGLRTYLTCVDPKQLDPRFAGREFDEALLNESPVCGSLRRSSGESSHSAVCQPHVFPSSHGKRGRVRDARRICLRRCPAGFGSWSAVNTWHSAREFPNQLGKIRIRYQ